MKVHITEPKASIIVIDCAKTVIDAEGEVTDELDDDAHKNRATHPRGRPKHGLHAEGIPKQLPPIKPIEQCFTLIPSQQAE